MKRKYLKYIAIFTLVPVLFLSGCSGQSAFEFNIMNELFEEFDEPASSNEPTSSDSSSFEKPSGEIVLSEDMNDAYINFSIELFKRSVQENQNCLVSPASVDFALTMATMGANGDTQTEMLNVLCPGATMEEVTSYAQNLNWSLTESENNQFYIANSMWTNETLLGNCLNDSYANSLKEKMNAEAYMLPFNDKAVKKINNWVDDNTDGMIPELLREISPDVAMYLINAMTFEGKWSDPYTTHQIQEKPFTNSLGTQENARMLCETGSHYLENDDAIGFLKYYESADYAFLAMLPNEEGPIEEFVAGMTAEDYKNFYNSHTTEYDVVTNLPCFTYSYDLNMNDALKDMGMPTAFDEHQADFGPMVTDENVDLYISNVIHKTYIELDENGTKAAAVTAIEMSTESAMMDPPEKKYVILDRPFVYAIVDTNTGIPIFIGTVNSVAE